MELQPNLWWKSTIFGKLGYASEQWEPFTFKTDRLTVYFQNGIELSMCSFVKSTTTLLGNFLAEEPQYKLPPQKNRMWFYLWSYTNVFHPWFMVCCTFFLLVRSIWLTWQLQCFELWEDHAQESCMRKTDLKAFKFKPFLLAVKNVKNILHGSLPSPFSLLWFRLPILPFLSKT